MRSSLSSSRVRAMVSLAGVALSLVGFFLPMFTESNPGVPGSAHPIYEWQVVMRFASSSVLAGSLAALSLLGVLIVLATSVTTLFAVCGPRLVLLKDLAAKWGLAIQLSFDFTVLQLLSIGSARLEIAWGFVVLLIGFIMIFGSALRFQKAGKRKKENVHLKRRSFLKLLTRTTISLAIGGLFIKAYIWDDPSKQWLLTDLFHNENETYKLTLAPPSGTLLTDASHLNSSIVEEIRSPKTVAEIIKAVRDAKSTNKKISLSGIRHSMGGQALGLNTLHLDMTQMDSVRYNDSDQTVTVGPGATWRQVQTSLSQHNRAVRVMQDSNIFSVGGSLSVNAHGKDPRYGSLIGSVNYLKMVTADGKEILCDKTQNKDLFSAVIGGYGLLGIITEVNLLTTQNSIYAFSLIPTQTHSVIDTLESLSKNPENRLLEAHLSVDGERFLTESLIYTYAEAKSSAKPKDELDGENSIWLRKVIFQASRTSNFGKFLRWELEKYLSPLIEPKTVSRNTAMAVPVRFLQNPDPHTTDILQEYFVPTEQANDFLERYKKLVKKYNINLLNVTIRKVNKDINALVSYAQKDMYGFVVYYKINQNSIDTQTLNAFTRELNDYLISIKATYYLCYGSYYSQSQLTTMYPEIRKLFVLKTQQDPDRLFSNLWYENIV